MRILFDQGTPVPLRRYLLGHTVATAFEIGAPELDLRGGKWEAGAWKITELKTLNRLPPELERLTSLRSFDISYCEQLTDLSPLASLTSPQSLDLSGCGRISDLSPLTSLTKLRSLKLYGCTQLSDLSPLASLTSLQALDLDGHQISDLSSLASLTSPI